MFKVNQDYLKLPGSYLFSTVARKQREYQAAHPEAEIIKLSIGDVTQPLAPAIVEALHGAVDEMAHAETFHGYAPDLGYEFLRSAIAKNDFQARGCDIAADEIFISDGAKSDSGNIQEIFGPDCRIAVGDPVYPVYVDTNVMAGRTGTYDAKTETWSNVIYMPCTAENNFCPELPKETPDIIYLCFPNNPTGEAITKEQLQVWVDYANKAGAVIIYDAAYKAYITEKDIPVSIISVKVQKPVPLSFAAFPRQPDLPDCVLHTRLSRKSSNAAMYSCMHSGQEDTAQNTMVHLTSSREPEKRYIPRLERLRSQNRSHIITRMHLISSTDSKKPAIPLRAA